MSALHLVGTLVIVSIVVAACASEHEATESSARPSTKPSAYPVAKKTDQVDDYHGTRVADPYRWLEDLDSPETRAWVQAENKVTFAYLDTIPERTAIRSRLTQLWNYEKWGTPSKRGGRYFFTKNDGLQNQSVLYWAPSLDAEPKVLLNPNTLTADGTIALEGTAVSEDGKFLAYGLRSSGSDWIEWKVRDIDTGTDLADDLKWIKFSGVSWTKDGSGLFYSRYDEPNAATMMEAANYYQKLFFHRVGTAQSEDVLVYQRPDQKEWGFMPRVTEDGRYLVIQVWKGTEDKYLIYYKDLMEAADSPVVELIREFEADFTFVGNDGPVFWFKTDLAAPRARIIAIDTTAPDRTNGREVVPQADETLLGATVAGDHFIASYLKDAHSHVRVFRLDGQLEREVALPGIGTASGFQGRRNDPETFYAFTSFTTPTTIFHYDVSNGASTVFRKPTVAFDPDAYETKQVFYASKDGTRIPMFISHRRGLKLDGSNPTLLYGYGGFNISLTPAFSVENLVWMEMGGIFAQPNLRGGGEYGEAWHLAGTKAQKQNVFDDFIAAAEWLIANEYTSTPKLAISGHSNGGLLVGACLTQRPDLFGAALPGVGVMDMLRFHKFTIGWAWTSDYGSSDDPAQFKALYAYSPLQNIKPGTHYPPTLVTTADHDDRVVPAHSFKFAATLQAAQTGDAPILIRIETKAGHGAGKPTAKQIEEAADTWAFLVRALHVKASIAGGQSPSSAR
ncbi:MAG: S9 family peptidase [Planctomycetes bacterium]|nr:S9 family peptidase [Planctomycetota bacterium]